jgi:hypothetical protein
MSFIQLPKPCRLGNCMDIILGCQTTTVEGPFLVFQKVILVSPSKKKSHGRYVMHFPSKLIGLTNGVATLTHFNTLLNYF